MATTSNGFDIEISLGESGQTDECVKVAFAGDGGQTVYLSPQQAREFASELIQTVYRAEVKGSLQRGQKRQPATPENVLQGSFPGSRLAGAQ